MVEGSSLREKARPLSGRRFLISVFILLLLGTGTRFYRLSRWSYYGDEVFSLRDARDSRVNPGKITFLRGLKPLGYLPIWLSHRVLGENEFASRFPAALFGGIAPAALALLSALIVRRRAALLIGLLVLASPWHLFWSQMARYYTVAFLLAGAGMILAYASIDRNSWGMALASSFLMIAAIGTHTTAGFLLVALAMYVLALLVLPVVKPAGLTWRNVLVFLAPFLLGCVAALAVAARMGEVFFATLSRFGQDPSQTAYGGHSPLMMMIRLMPSLVVFAGVPALLLPLVAIVGLWRDQRNKALFFACMIVGPMVCGFLYCFMHFVERRYLFISMATWIVGAGVGLDILMSLGRERGRWRLVGFGVLLLVLGFYLPGFAFHYKDGGRPNMKEALGTIEQQAAPGDLVVSNCMVSGSLNLYAPSKPLDFYRLPVVQLLTWKAEKLSEHVSDTRRTWYLIEYRRPGLPPAWLDWFWQNCRLVKLIEQPRFGYMEWNLGLFVHEPEPIKTSSGAVDH
jgi:4-amino-4-deoxy-L-arabinose transferase-like glycosyltransferase